MDIVSFALAYVPAVDIPYVLAVFGACAGAGAFLPHPQEAPTGFAGKAYKVAYAGINYLGMNFGNAKNAIKAK